MNLFRKKTEPKIVIASLSKTPFELFPGNKYIVQEAITSSGLAKALESDPALVVADVDTLVFTDLLTRDALDAALNTIRANGIPVLSSKELADFDANSLAKVNTKTGVRFAAPTVVAITNYAGGVGKTTVALSTAKLMKESTGLGVALVEAGSGTSVLSSKIGVSALPSMYDLINNPEDNKPYSWEGVDIYPMKQREAESLMDDPILQELFKKIIASHTLTIFDVCPNNPVWPLIMDLANIFVIVSTPNDDSVDQSTHLYSELLGYNVEKERILIFLNKIEKLYQRIGIDFTISGTIPNNTNAAQSYSSKIAGPVLHALYPAFYRISGKQKMNKNKSTGIRNHNDNGNNGKVKILFKK